MNDQVHYTTSTLKINQFKNGFIKSNETRNDGITVRKSLLWHLLQHA